MWKTILDILFPIHCLSCHQEGNFICFNCFKKIPLNTQPPLNNLLIASYYKNPLIKDLIHRYKYDFVKDLANPLGLLMIKRLNSFSDILNKDNSILIPVPLHKKRLRWRGFNQAELLAQEINKELKIPMINNLLIRTRYTPPQVKIENAQQRKQNIEQAFALQHKVRPYKAATLRSKVTLFRSDLISHNLENKTLILIDDISTTSATLDECTKALESLKPKDIWSLVIAKG